MEPELPHLPHTGLNGSALQGLLASWSLVDHPVTPRSPVDGLALWLDWKVAIPLSAALQAPPGSATTAACTSAAPLSEQALKREFARVHAALSRAIADETDTAREDGASFVPFRQRYGRLQQAMEAAIGPLRARLRRALAQRPPPQLGRLAALDAVLATALAAREQALLGQMPALLERHHTRLRQAQLGRPENGLAALQPPHTPHSNHGLHRFRRDMQRLLMAELDLRLQPAQGLLETLLDHSGDASLS